MAMYLLRWPLQGYKHKYSIGLEARVLLRCEGNYFPGPLGRMEGHTEYITRMPKGLFSKISGA